MSVFYSKFSFHTKFNLIGLVKRRSVDSDDEGGHLIESRMSEMSESRMSELSWSRMSELSGIRLSELSGNRMSDLSYIRQTTYNSSDSSTKVVYECIICF